MASLEVHMHHGRYPYLDEDAPDLPARGHADVLLHGPVHQPAHGPNMSSRGPCSGSRTPIRTTRRVPRTATRSRSRRRPRASATTHGYATSPAVALGRRGPGAGGQPVAISAKVADPGDGAPLVVDWGDGSAAEQATVGSGYVHFTDCTLVLTPTRNRSAPYTATLSADDGDAAQTPRQSPCRSASRVALDVERSVDEDGGDSSYPLRTSRERLDARARTPYRGLHTDPVGELEVSASA